MTGSWIAVECARWVDPASVFLGLFAAEPEAFWLDAGPDATDGWSWIGAGTAADAADVRAVVCGASPSPSADGGAFRGGWVGWIGYDDAAARAGAPALRDRADIPGERWQRVTRLAAFDHAARRIWVHAGAGDARRLSRAIADVTESAAVLAPPPDRGTARGRHRPDAYAALIERCRSAIRDGEAYQLCLTTRFAVEDSFDPVETYLRLRGATPAHHGGFVRSGDVALLSASPERFLQIVDDAAGRRVRTHPIKGTRPRGDDDASDAALAAELLASEKERAENVMIVDLMRNDLSRVCEPGTVAAERLLAVESYPAVHQLVSTVSGRLEAGTTVDGLLAATFPAGSMTGAPKLSAMKILRVLEGGARGVFAGCFGWVGDDGALDLAMVIRSVVVHPGGAYVGAGGGITWRSDAAAEVAEVGIKARAPLAALGARLPQGW